MALFYPALMKAVTARLQADTTLVGYMGGATSGAQAMQIAWTFPKPAVDPRGTTYPFVSLWPIADSVEDSFEGRKLDFTFEAHIFAEVAPTAVDSTLLKMVKIHERLIGDWAEQSNRTPTYGLDRWFPDFTGYTGDAATAYVPDMVTYRGFNDLTGPLDDRREWALTFETTMQKHA